jgi:hypothetical protein
MWDVAGTALPEMWDQFLFLRNPHSLGYSLRYTCLITMLTCNCKILGLWRSLHRVGLPECYHRTRSFVVVDVTQAYEEMLSVIINSDCGDMGCTGQFRYVQKGNNL